jgi:hypothetical protein
MDRRWRAAASGAAQVFGGAALVASFLAAALSALLLFPQRVEASHQNSQHVKGTYPNVGFLWLDDIKQSRSSGGLLWVYSDRCKAAEPAAWAYLRGQLAGGAPEFRGAWPRGIEFVKSTCTSTVDQWADVMLDYMTATQWTNAGHGSYGGHHHVTMADSAWCASFGARYPCGYHVSRFHINEPRFDGYSATYKTWFFTHETSHAMGFLDYCGHTSVANNDYYCPFHPSWYSLDKKLLRDVVYKNSPVHW